MMINEENDETLTYLMDANSLFMDSNALFAHYPNIVNTQILHDRTHLPYLQ